jgi:ABC-type lipoprotein release transport system permease subunit
VAFTVAPVVLVAAAIAASVGPALRAASTDPATTLRGGS